MASAESPSGASPPRQSLLAYLQLLRLPNVFTAIADVAMGYLVAHGPVAHESLISWLPLAVLIIASTALYLAGMVLNDKFDATLDALERPERPIPSGRISAQTASRLGFGLLVLGVVAGWTVAAISGRLLPGLVASGLAALILAYDGWLKSTILAPLAMGGCRLLNVLLGMTGATDAWHDYYWLVAGGIGLYIAGVTWFARTEARESHRSQLAVSMLIMLAGIALVAWYPAWRLAIDPQQDPLPERWYLFWCAIGAMVAWRCLRAIADPRPLVVQLAVKNCILSLIIIDAAACLATTGPLPALLILALILPAMFLGQWIYST